ncbi:MAG: Xaa-Pro peptidase family protein [Desulfurococcaceae archaeon]
MIEALRDIAESRGLDVLVLSAPDNIEYFTGVPTIGDAVLLMIYDKRQGTASLYVPLLEYQRYRDMVPPHVDVYAVSRTLKPPHIPIADLDWKDIIARYRNVEKIGADISHVSPLQGTVQATLEGKVIDVSNDIWKVRMIKSNRELESIKEATKVTLKGILAIYSELREGVTETALTGVFEKTIRDHGVERAAFDPIIAFKPNNAYPHTLPGNRGLSSRDLVLVDVGVKVGGRCSDVTRMILWGRPSREERRGIEAVVEALETAIDAIKPGIRAGEVYETAVKVLENYGLREKFIHGLGHGIGIVVHEPPYLRRQSDTVLEPGMVFTVEPGVYFPGKYGIRVEEVVLVTKKGAHVLSKRLEKVLQSL